MVHDIVVALAALGMLGQALIAALVLVALAALVGIGTPLAAAERPVTFHKDVLPILQHRCQSCHRPGEVARPCPC